MKNKIKIKEFEQEKFLQALKQGVIKSQNLYEKAKEIDERVSNSSLSFEEILAIIDKFMTEKNDYNKIEGKYVLQPYGRVCLELDASLTSVFLQASLCTALTYNSAIIYSYSIENYAVNMYLLTLINETLKRFLAVNYIILQIGEVPKLVKNIFYIVYDNNLKYSLKKGGKTQDFTLNTLLVKSRAKWY